MLPYDDIPKVSELPSYIVTPRNRAELADPAWHHSCHECHTGNDVRTELEDDPPWFPSELTSPPPFWQRSFHECHTENDIRNALDNGRSSIKIDLSHNLPELSDRRQTRGRCSGEFSTNVAPQIDRDKSVVSPLSDINSPNRTSTHSPLSDGSVSPVVEATSEETTVMGQLPNVATQTPNSQPDMYIQTCNLAYQHVDYQTVTGQSSKISDLLSQFPRIGRDSSEHVLTTAEYLPGVLRERVNILNQSWIQKLSRYHGPDVRFSPSMLFEKGIQSVQDFHRGILPRTFEDIFALMHIVHACACIFHKKDDLHFRHTLFLDVLQWQHAISTEEDTQLFLDVAFRIWSVPDCSIAEADRYTSNFRSQLCWSLPEIELGGIGSPRLSYSQQSAPQNFDLRTITSIMSPINLDTWELVRLREALRGGLVINLCARYLGGKLLFKIEII